MAGPLEVRHPRRKSWAYQAALLNVLWQRCIVGLLTVPTETRMAAMFHHLHRDLRYFSRWPSGLKFTWWLLQRSHSAAAIRAAVHSVIHHPVNLCGSERLTFVARVALLATDGTLFPRRQGRWWRLDNITGWRSGRIRGVFRQPGHLGQQRSHLFGKCGPDASGLLQRCNSGIALSQLRPQIDDQSFQFGNTLLIGLFGRCLHAVSTNPLIRLFYRTDCVQRSNFTLNFTVEIYLLFFWGGYTLSKVRLIVSLTGRKGRERLRRPYRFGAIYALVPTTLFLRFNGIQT